MKKVFASILAAALLLCCACAVAENTDAIRGELTDGAYVLRVPVKAEDGGDWRAVQTAQETPAVRLAAAQMEGDELVIRFEPENDGEETVYVNHYDGFVCDISHGFDLLVKDGAIQEVTGGSFTASPADAELTALLEGEWLEAETQFTTMKIAPNPDKGWDVEIASPVSHAAYVFRATIRYDCVENALVYVNGALYDAPLTDDGALKEPTDENLSGILTLAGESESDLRLVWGADANPENREITLIK